MLRFLLREVDCAMYASLAALLLMSVLSMVLPRLFPNNKKLEELMSKVNDMECALIMAAIVFVSVLLGYIFFREKLNKKRIFSILLVIISILIMIFLNIKTLPWVGIIVALSWAFYNLVRKKINIETDIGLLIESLYIFPFALIVFYFIFDKGLNDFSLSNPGLSMFLLLAGPMTVIPLFLYVRGVELIGLGATGMIFYITPTLQFILGYFYYNEDFSLIKLVSFIIIWIAVIIYLKDLYETN